MTTQVASPPPVESPAPQQSGPPTRTNGWLALGVGPAIAIAALAGALRFGALDLAAYQYDEADVLLRTYDALRGTWPLTGAMTSWGVPDPPLMVYLVALVAWLPQPPLAASGLMALLNTGAVLLTYVLARRHFGPWVGLSAGLLYAANPWAVYFSRRYWTEIVPLFTVVALWAALEVLSRRDRRWIVPFALALGLQIQTRLLGVLYLPAAAMTVLPTVGRWGWRLVPAGALAVVVSLPFLVHVFIERERLGAALAEGGRGLTPEAKTNALDLVLWFSSGLNLLPLGSRYAPELRVLALPMQGIHLVCAALLAIGLAWAIVLLVRRVPRASRYGLLLIWVVVPIGLLAAQSSSLFLHYMVLLVPLPFLLMALPLGWLLGAGGMKGAVLLRALGTLLLVTIIAVQIVLTLALYTTLGIYDVGREERASPAPQPSSPATLKATNLPRETAQAIGTGESYGVEIPLRYWLTVRESVMAQAGHIGTNQVLVLTDGTDPLSEERPALLQALFGPTLAPRFLSGAALAIPLGRESLLVEAWGLEPAEAPQRLGQRVDVVPLPTSSRSARDGVRIYRLPARDPTSWAALAEPIPAVSWPGGLDLVGTRMPSRIRPGNDTVLVTYWVTHGGAQSASGVVARLVDERGQRVVQREVALPHLPAELHGLVMRHDLTMPGRTPSGRYRLELAIEGQTETLGTLSAEDR